MGEAKNLNEKKDAEDKAKKEMVDRKARHAQEVAKKPSTHKPKSDAGIAVTKAKSIAQAPAALPVAPEAAAAPATPEAAAAGAAGCGCGCPGCGCKAPEPVKVQIPST